MNRTKNEKSKDNCKADLRQRVLFFMTIFRLAIPAFFRFTDVYVMFRPRFLQLICSFIIEQTRFLGTVFLNSEFKLEDIYSGVNFGRKNLCVNFYLRELIFADRWKNRKNQTRKNFVPPGKVVFSWREHVDKKPNKSEEGWNHLPEMTCILQKFSSLMILIPPLFA